MDKNISRASHGFTVIELIITAVFLTVAGIVVAWQFNNVATSVRDDKRKIAINSLYYGLEEVYYKQHNAYPEKITDETIKSVDPKLLTDPSGKKLGESDSSYRYEPSQCVDGKCAAYSLRADLETESDYVKKNRDRN